MSNKLNHAGVMILASLLAACGGEEQGSSSETTPPDMPVTISLKDASLAYRPYQGLHEIDLTRYVTTSDNSPFKLTHVEALSTESECQVVSLNDAQFSVAGETKKACYYRYFVESVNGKSTLPQSQGGEADFGLVSLATTDDPDNVQLQPIHDVTLLNTSVEIDLKEKFDEIGEDVSAWTLSKDVTTPYGHGSVEAVDVAKQKFTYSPKDGFTGIDRVLFQFTDENQEVRLGNLDIAVSVKANKGFDVQADIEYEDSIPYGKQEEISIKEYVKSADGDDYQLVYLQSYHASVTSSDPYGDYNKKFAFTSTKLGENIVNFAVSDHKGAYALGSMKIDVEGDTPWDDIVYDGERFLAPLTTKQANAQGIVYEQEQSDSDYPSLEMALMTPPQFEAYCASRGASVPTLDQWQELTSNVKIKDDHQWPVQYGFVVDNNGTYEQAMDDGSSSPLNGAVVKPMCVQSSYLLVVPSQSDLEAVADSQDQAEVAVRVTFGGELVKGENVSASLSAGSSAQLDSGDAITDENGVATFKLTNMKAETLTLTAEYGSNKVDEQVSFIADVNTAKLILNTTVDNQPYGGTNQVTATLEDAFDNPLVGYEVDFSAETYASSVDVQPQGQTDTDGKQVANVTWTDTIPTSVDTPVSILAEFDEGLSLSADRSNVTFIFGMCGGQVNDTNKDNAKGNCLKVAEASGKWFTSSPSMAVMDALGYIEQNSSSNSGKTYSGTYIENGSYGPSRGEFAGFRQDGRDGRQHQRYCQHLADIGFAGRSDWQRPSRDELKGLHDKRGNMWTNFGWPTFYYYWSGTPTGLYFYNNVNLFDGQVSYYYPKGLGYGSCVSSN